MPNQEIMLQLAQSNLRSVISKLQQESLVSSNRLWHFIIVLSRLLLDLKRQIQQSIGQTSPSLSPHKQENGLHQAIILAEQVSPHSDLEEQISTSHLRDTNLPIIKKWLKIGMLDGNLMPVPLLFQHHQSSMQAPNLR